jgi:hypothetical protein
MRLITFVQERPMMNRLQNRVAELNGIPPSPPPTPTPELVRQRVVEAERAGKVRVLPQSEIGPLLDEINAGGFIRVELFSTPDFQRTAYAKGDRIYIFAGGFGAPTVWKQVTA